METIANLDGVRVAAVADSAPVRGYNMEHFIECVREGKTPSCGAADGLNAMRIVDGLKESIAAGQAVDLS